MVVLAAAGDNCSGGGSKTAANVDVPASCPHVLGCGETFKTPSLETVWDNTPGQFNGRGTGGGYSMLFPAQSFQIGAPAAPTNVGGGKGRMVPDVAGNADPNSGYTIYVHGSQHVVGGTSAVAPLYAGLFAALGRKLRFVTPRLWQEPARLPRHHHGQQRSLPGRAGPEPLQRLGRARRLRRRSPVCHVLAGRNQFTAGAI
jgi:kumamolisin